MPFKSGSLLRIVLINQNIPYGILGISMVQHIETQIFIGLDIGSTTVKAVVLDTFGNIVFSRYKRHFSEVRKHAASVLNEIDLMFPGAEWSMSLTGSGSIALSLELDLHFIQEVSASNLAIQRIIPEADVVIELGGEDAKLTFLTGGLDQRMNETCAGGTGAFIDQMAAFIQTDALGLDELALHHKVIYPIASRCGVFAKTDVLPYLNDGCSREDLAASIMQAVVNQTISGLARGRAIKGTVVFLGGPLAFLRSLRERFQASLKEATKLIFPENGEFFVAIGAAFESLSNRPDQRPLEKLIDKLEQTGKNDLFDHLPPLFTSRQEYDDFRQLHQRDNVKSLSLEDGRGEAWLGFDSGSTTLKAALVDAEGRLLYSFYGSNHGDPLSKAVGILKDIYTRKHPTLKINAAAVTGYGSGLLAAGLKADIDEVETVAHFTAAHHFDPQTSFILDIGGQDIKCLHIKDGAIDRIKLNEACSAGCGSFIENFAASLQIPLDDFVAEAIKAEHPVDLGTRCTVFMNSKVKQAQKDGANIGDIAAGLSYSVIRNACFKVIKVTEANDLGEHVVAQGGAFLNDALLRALELQIGLTVVRPNIAGLMGAYGAALIARDRCPTGMATSLITPEEVNGFTTKLTTVRCGRCTNNCLLTITTFADKRRFISGNRCENAIKTEEKKVPNLYAYKYKRLFEHYIPLEAEQASRGLVGLPRTLNMYENYPLWFTMFTHLGFRVELSAPSSKELFLKGYESIPSQTVCYPAKLAHGHVLDLIDHGITNIFFPCIPKEQLNFTSQANTYNCPVVTGYPELIDKNISKLRESGTSFIHEFLPLDELMLARRLKALPLFAGIPFQELEEAVHVGFAEMVRFHADMESAGEKALDELKASRGFGIVLAGHPYHVDPGVHHGIAELITSCGLGVLTEDSVAHLKPAPTPLRVIDQWTYHARLYRAGAFVASVDNLAILQLVSFGCGLDAITSDQLEEIVAAEGRLYAQIKIDEGVNLGPARIRIRSLLAALRERQKRKNVPVKPSSHKPATFTEDMRQSHTILIPQMSPIHFRFIEPVFKSEGYKVVQLPEVDPRAIELALHYVNNDACYPAIVVIGQLLQALKSGEYDKNRVALMITQTGGGCRATNYIALLRKALSDCHLEHIPIVSITTNINAHIGQPGLNLSIRMLLKLIMAGHYGDALMKVMNRVTPYEAEPGSADKLAEKWIEKGKKNLETGGIIQFDLNMLALIKEFDQLPLRDEKRKPRVGLVGEILLKYHPDANNHVVKVVQKEGGEAVSTDLMNFVLYSLYDHVFSYKHLNGTRRNYTSGLMAIAFLEFTRWTMRLGFKRSKHFTTPTYFGSLKNKVRNLISLGHQTGEGWLLTAEMIEFLESGISNIICLQPFGCLPNHITGKGLLQELKRRYPEANIVALDYDSGASEVNQVNRIKLMMSRAA